MVVVGGWCVMMICVCCVVLLGWVFLTQLLVVAVVLVVVSDIPPSNTLTFTHTHSFMEPTLEQRRWCLGTRHQASGVPTLLRMARSWGPFWKVGHLRTMLLSRQWHSSNHLHLMLPRWCPRDCRLPPNCRKGCDCKRGSAPNQKQLSRDFTFPQHSQTLMRTIRQVILSD